MTDREYSRTLRSRPTPSRLNTTQRKRIAQLEKQLAHAKTILASVGIVAADRIAPHRKLWTALQKFLKG